MDEVEKLAIRCVFADDTKTTITIDNINPGQGGADVSYIKRIVDGFNAEQGGELSTKMKSKNGFNWIGIDSAVITHTERTYIF